MFIPTQDAAAWKMSMHSYQKQKRTKKPFGSMQPFQQRITQAQMKEKDRKFNPVLQVHKNPIEESKHYQNDQIMRTNSLQKHLVNLELFQSQSRRYEKDYDIINNHSSKVSQSAQSKPPTIISPVRNIYNVINNQKLPQFHFTNRPMKLPIQHPFKPLSRPNKEYNIISNDYREDNQERLNREMSQSQIKIMQKYDQNKVYDPVFGRYYDTKREEEYQRQVTKSNFEHGKEHEKRLPPSYVKREPLILDHSKPYSYNLQELDIKNANAKKRYQLRYMIQQEYQKRNQEFNEKKEAMVRNRIHNSRLLQNISKQFDIVNSQNYSPSRTEDLYKRKSVNSTWDALEQESRGHGGQGGIKSSGFAYA